MHITDRDTAIRNLATEISRTCEGQDVGMSLGAAALFIVAQAEIADNQFFTLAAARKMRQAADLLDPPVVKV